MLEQLLLQQHRPCSSSPQRMACKQRRRSPNILALRVWPSLPFSHSCVRLGHVTAAYALKAQRLCDAVFTSPGHLFYMLNELGQLASRGYPIPGTGATHSTESALSASGPCGKCSSAAARVWRLDSVLPGRHTLGHGDGRIWRYDLQIAVCTSSAAWDSMVTSTACRTQKHRRACSASAHSQACEMRRPCCRQNGQRAVHLERDALPHGLAGCDYAGWSRLPCCGNCTGCGVCG